VNKQKGKTTEKAQPSREEIVSGRPQTRGHIPANEVMDELERMLESREFHASKRSKAFLRFVVEETLAGRTETIKGYTIATRVFGRDKDFDPLQDPIVRIQAGKLRKEIEHYYFTEGRDNPIHLRIPKGTYVPIFLRRLEDAHSHSASVEPQWPSLALKPFRNLTNDMTKNLVADGLTTELAIELGRYQDLRVFTVPPGSADHTGYPATFCIEGSLNTAHRGFKVMVTLTNTVTGQQILADQFDVSEDTSSLILFQERFIQALASKICDEQGIISRTLSEESRRRPPVRMQTYEAMLKYYHADATGSAEAFAEALHALKDAVEKEPYCGIAWGMLARSYATAYGLGIPDIDTCIEPAIQCIQKALQLEPAKQRIYVIRAYIHLLNDELPRGLKMISTARKLNPNSLHFMDAIGYLLTLLGEWKEGPRLIIEAIALNPFHRPSVHHALWVDAFRRKAYEEALETTYNFRMHDLFWEPLMKAATLGHLGQHEQASEQGARLLQLKSAFKQDGLTLIRRYIKFDDIVNRIVEGLGKAGLDLA
jgi:TolB-like protein